MSEYLDYPFEAIWIDSKLFLEREHGYKIHSKYDLSFRPKSKLEHEEAVYCQLARPSLAHAVRQSDGADVMLKALDRDSPELEIGTFFSQLSDPRNHCVPIYDVLHPPMYPHKAIIVMPLLREFQNPPFDTVGEVVDCFRQLIEGVQYMHKYQVAHRDISILNIMMDGLKMYPQGFNPGLQSSTRDFSGDVSPSATRTRLWPRYFLIDFGHARRYPLGEIPYEEKISGADYTAPEHHTEGFGCNPFPTDVYYLGNMLRREFLDRGPRKCVGLEIFRPLVVDMIKKQPSERPTIDEVANRYHQLTQLLSKRNLRSACQVDRDEEPFWWIGYAIRRIRFTLARRNPLPPADSPIDVLQTSLKAFYTQERQVESSTPVSC